MTAPDPSFTALGLLPPLLRAVEGAGYGAPTPIQAQCIPTLLGGRDLCGTAQTGTGKTAAFALPILQRLAGGASRGGPCALVLAPTRELALQIAESFKVYGQHLPELKCAVVYGGMGMRAQRRAMEAGVDILVATTGRLLDLCRQGALKLDKVEVLVLDEADRLLDMGFIEDVRTVLRLVPVKRQSVLFSATMPPAVEKLAKIVLKSPIRVSVAAPAAVAAGIEEGVHRVAKSAKRAKLMEILADPAVSKVVIFVRTRHGADRLQRALVSAGVKTGVVHGDKAQAARFRAIDELSSGAVRVLVATDVAARGLDIDGITHVINYDMPNEAETYVHRIGRTGRAGARGVAISLVSPEEASTLEEIEWQAGRALPILP